MKQLSVLVLGLVLVGCSSAPQKSQPIVTKPVAPAVASEWVQTADVQAFIGQMVLRYGFKADSLQALLNQAQLVPSLIQSMNHPSETRLVWYQYQALFIKPAVIQGGKKFMLQHEHVLHVAQERYGVPPGIIVGILGAETRYGQNEGSVSALNALYTLAFAYPRRGAYFQNELAQFLVLTRDAKLDPVAVKSSYAGALGMPQFMPSSYREYAVSSGPHYPDLFSDFSDVVLSVGHYFAEKGWQSGEPIAVQVTMLHHQAKMSSLIGQTLTLRQFAQAGVVPLPSSQARYPHALAAKLITLQGKTAPEYWLLFHNFNVIKRYNASDLYAMTVFQLSELVAQ